MRKKYIADIILVISLVILTLVTSIFIYKKQTSNKIYVEVSINGEITNKYSVDENIEIMLKTGNVLVIKDGNVCISNADCPDGLCVKQGTISKANESIICLPNKLVVRIVEDNTSLNKDDDNDTGVDVIQ
ncbi:MAG: NusG domain II-containing protein [Lachnospiraceae bacterium]|nr:NusG domain II-containing protein [Lachnospiraceae bacterium]